MLWAVGGGSVIDAAKAAAGVIPCKGSISDYFHGRRDLTDRSLPLIAAPTTSGTGTELTRNAVLLEPETKIKKSIRHDSLIPRVALIDPCLTYSCPRDVMTRSGLDAFVQAVESYISKNANNTTKALALKAAGMVASNLPVAFRDADDKGSRTALAEASMLSGMAFSQSGLGAVHALAHPIGALLDLDHGLACAILLPHILRINAPCCGAEYAELGAACGGGEFVAIVKKLNASLAIPATLNGKASSDKARKFVIANCRGGSMRTNPRDLTDSEVDDLLRSL